MKVGVSELVDTEDVAKNSPERGAWTSHKEVKRPLGGGHVKRHGSDCEALYTMRSVGGKPRRQNRGSIDVGQV